MIDRNYSEVKEIATDRLGRMATLSKDRDQKKGLPLTIVQKESSTYANVFNSGVSFNIIHYKPSTLFILLDCTAAIFDLLVVCKFSM